MGRAMRGVVVSVAVAAVALAMVPGAGAVPGTPAVGGQPPALVPAAVKKTMTLTPSGSYAEVGSPVLFTLTAPKKTSAFRVERKLNGQWVHGDTVGSITSVKQKSTKVKVTGTLLPISGAASFRVTAKKSGDRVRSNASTVRGYSWMPLWQVAAQPQQTSVTIGTTTLPVLLSITKETRGESGQVDFTVGYSCRRVEIGSTIDGRAETGSMTFRFVTAKGQVVEQYASVPASASSVAGYDLDGSALTLSAIWTGVTGKRSFDPTLTWAGQGWCSPS